MGLHDLTIAYAEAGQGEPILLLHGWGADSALVWPLAERLVRRGYRCLALDLPGFGESQQPPTAWSVFDYAALVLAYLDAQQLESVFLFGHSFGGRLGLILGADHGARIRKMVLSNAAGLRPQTPFWATLRLRSYKAVRAGLGTIGLKGLSDELRQRYNRRYGSSDFQQVSGVLRETFVKVVNEDLRPYAERVQPSTLLFWGDQDEDTPLWMGRTLEQIMPDAGLVIHEGAGHYAYLDQLEKTAQVMDYFFTHDATSHDHDQE